MAVSPLRRFCALASLLAAAAPAAVASCGGSASTVITPNGKPCALVGEGSDVLPGPPDGASLCPAGACNYQSQTGCPSTETCAIHIDDTAGTATPACEATGTAAQSAACSDTKPCGRGLVCVDDVCRKLCCGGDWSACDAGESCVQQVKVSIAKGAIVDPKVGICVSVNDCNVLDAHSCTADPTRPVCRIADPIGNVACQPAAALGVGDSCDSEHQCGPVMICAGSDGNAGAESVCRSLCRADLCGTPSCPNLSDTCVHFHRDPSGVGECTPNFQGPYADAGTVSDVPDSAAR